MELEDEAYLVTSQVRELSILHPSNILLIQKDSPGGRLVESTDDVEEGGLA